MTRWRWPAAVGTAALVAAVLAGCGSTRAGGTGPAAPPVTPSLATSASYPDGTWAVLVMGGSAAEHNNFWQVFVRPAGKQPAWQLATPVGAASNGGFAVAATGGPSLAAALLPSQDLRFSPLSRSTDNGAKWAAAGLLGSGLASTPSALAGAPDGGLIALTRGGAVEVASHPGGSWARLATERSVAGSAAARSCGLTGLTAVGYTASGSALLAGGCSRGGHVGIFQHRAGGWVAAGPALPAALASRPVTVLQLARSGRADVALLQAGTGAAASLVGAWSTGNGTGWRLSAPYRLAGAQPRSAAVAGQALGVLLTGGHAVTLAGPGVVWQPLPTLPAGSATLPAGAVTLAAGPAGGFQLLTGRLSRFSVWTAGASGWTQSQTVKVSIPYGSSG